MTFDEIIPDSLWSVRYDGEKENAFYQAFDNWSNPEWLHSFFCENKKDLKDYFRITNIDRAVYDTLDESDYLQYMILDLAIESNLDQVFRPLEPSRSNDVLLGREKAKGLSQRHTSWLRLYAFKVEEDRYIVTGGTIKLTPTMQERQHTSLELQKMETVRNYLISEGVVDSDGFIDYLQA